MWIFTIYGFFSVTQPAIRGRGKLQVRARRREHLERLIDAHFSECPAGKPDILTTLDSDYRYRIVVPKRVWLRVMRDMTAEIQYSNFKNAAAAMGDQEYVDAANGVWMRMLSLQETGAARGSLYPWRVAR